MHTKRQPINIIAALNRPNPTSGGSNPTSERAYPVGYLRTKGGH